MKQLILSLLLLLIAASSVKADCEPGKCGTFKSKFYAVPMESR